VHQQEVQQQQSIAIATSAARTRVGFQRMPAPDGCSAASPVIGRAICRQLQPAAACRCPPYLWKAPRGRRILVDLLQEILADEDTDGLLLDLTRATAPLQQQQAQQQQQQALQSTQQQQQQQQQQTMMSVWMSLRSNANNPASPATGTWGAATIAAAARPSGEDPVLQQQQQQQQQQQPGVHTADQQQQQQCLQQLQMLRQRQSPAAGAAIIAHRPHHRCNGRSWSWSWLADGWQPGCRPRP